MAKTFLKAEWRKLIMANYVIDSAILEPYLPAKTELDIWEGKCYVSLIGFLFKNTAVKGFKIPFHTQFEEVNLRFYVRHLDNGVWKRGVVFIKEIVPKFALTWVANMVYKENYETMPMSHSWDQENDLITVVYKWKKDKWNTIKVIAAQTAIEIEDNSEAAFISEHYWGYTRLSDNETSEYGVEHPKWKIYPVESYEIDVDFEKVYGADFGFLKNKEPYSVFLSEGSEIEVKNGRILYNNKEGE